MSFPPESRLFPALRGIFVLLFIFSFKLPAATLRVPAEYPRIQTAIDASRNGDVILVSPGVYNENVTFKGKAITLSSTNAVDPTVVSSTIIHAPGRGSAVTFTNAEGSNSVLTGFTLSGGYGTLNLSFGTNAYFGGGVYCYRSAPRIVGNNIGDNHAPNGQTNLLVYGAGIACVEASPVIARNWIAGNQANAGGGVLTYLGQARIVSNLIVSNSAGVGGGLALIAGGQLIHNTVVRNEAEAAGNVYAASEATTPCYLSGNIIAEAWSGGGVYVENPETLTLMTYNDVWNNAGGDYGTTNRTGSNGNISQDPEFVDPANNDFRLHDSSPCINAGDPNLLPAAGELDFYGGTRYYAGRVDIGAHEYADNFRPLANAGPDRTVTVTALPASIALDGSASSDPNGAPLSYQWTQRDGASGSFDDPNAVKPSFRVTELGRYSFQLIVHNGSVSSFVDPVEVWVTNAAPTARAGDDQLFSDLEPVAMVTLDGSRSSDPENVGLKYRWKQIEGWRVALSDPAAAQPSFAQPWPGVYRFELIVNDGLQDSAPDVVAIVIGPNQAPIANAGPARYVTSGSVMLDGTASYDPDGYGTLTYQWRQVSGPAVNVTGTNTPTAVVTGLPLRATLLRYGFELVVSDGKLTSVPAAVTVTIVPNYGSNVLVLVNPPFNPARPTIVAFGGGNCSTGSGMGFGGVWEEAANWISVNTYGPSYTRYGDMLMVYLSNVAPDYRQPIQTIGFSTGNLPAMDVAWHVNVTYKDARYAVNRVSLLDPVCSHLAVRVAQFHTNRVAGEQAWVDNYISNDPNFARRPIIAGALNVVCNPARGHSYPVDRYYTSSLEYTNGGLTAFGYLSLIGSGKNYQLNTASQKYYFTINASGAIVQFNPSVNPGKIMAPVRLQGPADGSIVDSNGVTLGSEPVENAVGYQLLVGSDPDRVMDYTILSDTTNPPSQALLTLPQPRTWWTVRAYDQFGSTIHSDPRLLQRAPNHAPLANGGADQVIYAGLEGTASALLTGAQSSDPNANALTYRWAWRIGDRIFQTNAMAFSLELPIGVHTVQLMVHDGEFNSSPDEVTIRVVAPLQCVLKMTPATINLRSQGPHLHAQLILPEGMTPGDFDPAALLKLYPGEVSAVRQWTSEEEMPVSVLAFFDKASLRGQLHPGPLQLTVAGKLKSGRVVYGRDTVKILEGPGRGE